MSERNAKFFASLAELAILYKIPEPNAPINVTAKIANGNIGLIRWEDNSDDDNGFVIEADSGEGFVVLDSVSSKVLYYLHKNLQPGQTYTYRIRAYNSGGYSDPSEEVSVTMEGESGVDELKVDWQVYPNPFKTQLTVTLPQLDDETTIRVVSLQGKVMASQKLAPRSDNLKIATDQFPSGVYIVELLSGGKKSR